MAQEGLYEAFGVWRLAASNSRPLVRNLVFLAVLALILIPAAGIRAQIAGGAFFSGGGLIGVAATPGAFTGPNATSIVGDANCTYGLPNQFSALYVGASVDASCPNASVNDFTTGCGCGGTLEAGGMSFAQPCGATRAMGSAWVNCNGTFNSSFQGYTNACPGQAAGGTCGIDGYYDDEPWNYGCGGGGGGGGDCGSGCCGFGCCGFCCGPPPPEAPEALTPNDGLTIVDPTIPTYIGWGGSDSASAGGQK